MPTHEVKQGEYLTLIARRVGIPWKEIWDASENKALREKRKSPNVLCPGDKLFIPEKNPRNESGGSAKQHPFQLPPPSQRLRLVLRDEFDKPLMKLKYTMTIDSKKSKKGATDGDGLIDEKIPTDAQLIELELPDLKETWRLHVGHLDPVSRLTGVQQRLKNLGFDPGPIDGIFGPRTSAAIRRFQQWKKLTAHGKADQETRDAIEKAHEGISRGIELEDDKGVPPSGVDTGALESKSDPPESAKPYHAERDE